MIVETDEGARGIGEACAYGVPGLIREWVAWMAPGLIGRDPRDMAIVPHPNGLSRAYDCAVAGLDTALWDLRGQLAGQRVCDMLREGAPDRVRLYASGGVRYDWRARPEQLVDEVLGYVAEGYTASKVRIGTDWTWDGVTVDRFLGLMRELAQAVDGRLELMVDGNQRLSEEQSMTIAHELDRLKFTWFEEPLPKENVGAYARLNAAVEMPITGGEGFTTAEQFRPYLEQRAYSIVQPDAGICGITEAFKIADVAARYGVELCPHSWHNGLMAMANAHLVAALARPTILEVCMVQGPLQWAILDQPPAMAAGYLTFPDRPGLGVDLAADLEKRFPMIEGHYAVEVER